MRIGLLIIFFILMQNVAAHSQIHLAIKNLAGKKKEEYFTGDLMEFKLKNDDIIHTAIIQSFDVKNQTVSFGGIPIKLSDFEVIYSQKQHRTEYENTLMLAGLLLPFVDQFNNLVWYQEDFSLDSGILIASGGLIASGLTIKLLRRNKYKLKRRFRLIFVF